MIFCFGQFWLAVGDGRFVVGRPRSSGEGGISGSSGAPWTTLSGNRGGRFLQ